MAKTAEFVREYSAALRDDLTSISKVVIDTLTTLAAENKEDAAGLAAALLDHANNCPTKQKLPALYLVDSIAKNVKEPYVSLFGDGLPTAFRTAWETAVPNLRRSLLKLYMTWKAVFPSSVLEGIDREMRRESQAIQDRHEAIHHVKADCGSQAGCKDRSALVKPGVSLMPPTSDESSSRDALRHTASAAGLVPSAVPVLPLSVQAAENVLQFVEQQTSLTSAPQTPASSAPPAGPVPCSVFPIPTVSASNLPTVPTVSIVNPMTSVNPHMVQPPVHLIPGVQAGSYVNQPSPFPVANCKVSMALSGGPPTAAVSHPAFGPGVPPTLQSNGMVPIVPQFSVAPQGQVLPLMRNLRAGPVGPIQGAAQGPIPVVKGVPSCQIQASYHQVQPQPYTPTTVSAPQHLPQAIHGYPAPQQQPPQQPQPGPEEKAPASTGLDVQAIYSMLEKLAEEKEKRRRENEVSVVDAMKLTPAVIKAKDRRVLKNLKENITKVKPKFLDWRFEVRRDRKKKGYKTRNWYAAPERWIDDSDPTEVTPVQLVKKLTEPKAEKPEKHIVLIDDDNPQRHCAISGDVLEKYFDTELEDWYYKDCRHVYGEEARINKVWDGAICIVSCITKVDERKNLLGIIHTPVDDILQAEMVSKDLMNANALKDMNRLKRPVVGTKRNCGDNLFKNEQFKEKRIKEEQA